MTENTGDTEKQTSESVDLCQWCGVPLGSANLVRQSVCIRCYKLLTTANVSYEEVFGKDHRRDENLLAEVETDIGIEREIVK